MKFGRHENEWTIAYTVPFAYRFYLVNWVLIYFRFGFSGNELRIQRTHTFTSDVTFPFDREINAKTEKITNS